MSLKSELDIFGELFKQCLSGEVKATLRWVSCEAVNWEDKTMTASDADGLEYFDVLLGVSTATVKPVKGTDCLVAIVENDDATAFLLFADEAELIEWNGGENGGLTITPKLVDELGKLTARVDGIIDAINSPTVMATPQDGGTAMLGLLRTELSKIVDKEDFTNIENEKITH